MLPMVGAIVAAVQNLSTYIFNHVTMLVLSTRLWIPERNRQSAVSDMCDRGDNSD
jgi:hypothetical protein